MPAEGELHGHKCGWSPTHSPDEHGKGCGHVFAHVQDSSVSSSTYAERHCCPKCGRGPWQNVWFPGVEEDWNSMPLEQRRALQAHAKLRILFNSILLLEMEDDEDG